MNRIFLKSSAIWILFFTALFTEGCRKNEAGAEVSAYEKLTEFRRSEFPGFKLTLLEECYANSPSDYCKGIEGKIPYKAYKIYTKPWDAYPNSSEYETIDVVFENLSATNFEFLKKFYGKSLSRIKFKEGNNYHLVDFLPPAMQAVNGFKGYALAQDSSTNCWSSAYEFLTLNDSDIYSYVTSPIEMVNVLESQKFASKLGVGEKLMPLDILFDRADSSEISPNIGHAVVFLDENLYFEKFGIGDNPFGISASSFGPARTKTVKEFGNAFRAKGPFPKAKDVFHEVGIDWKPNMNLPLSDASKSVKIQYNESDGRAHLSKKDIVVKPNLEFLIKNHLDFYSLSNANGREIALQLAKKEGCIDRVYQLFGPVETLELVSQRALFKPLKCQINSFELKATLLEISGKCKRFSSSLLFNIDGDFTQSLLTNAEIQQFVSKNKIDTMYPYPNSGELTLLHENNALSFRYALNLACKL